MSTLPTMMRVAQASKPGNPFDLAQKPVPEPNDLQVLIKRVRFKQVVKKVPSLEIFFDGKEVEACGLCHADVFTREGHWPGIKLPRVPGHEVAGTIVKSGALVQRFAVGMRVGVGWHGNHCGLCEPCRQGKFIICSNLTVSGVHIDGGFAEYMLAFANSLAIIPDGVPSHLAAPLMCAGVTTYNALRNSGARAGDVVAIQGMGGLGHLGIQYSKKMGYRTIAISKGSAKRQLVHDLGADMYIDTTTQNPAEELLKLGGAKVILATVPDAKSMSEIVNGLGPDGKLLVLGADAQPICVPPIVLLAKRIIIQGWASGNPQDAEETLNFSAYADVKPLVEIFPLEKANEAYDRMISNQARFRVVITP